MTSYKLGVVAFALMGVWLLAGALAAIIDFLLRMGAGGGDGITAFAVMSLVAHTGIGAALLLGRERLASVLLPRDEEETDGLPLDELLASALMILGVYLFVAGVWNVVRAVADGSLGTAPWTTLAPALVFISVGLLVFLSPERVLDLWRRSRTGGTT